MTSINTAKLVQLKSLEDSHRGPGSYNVEAGSQAQKQLGIALKSAFGTNETRKTFLENTSPSAAEIPAPNQYIRQVQMSPKNVHQNSANFLSAGERFKDSEKALYSPNPSTYNTAKYKAIGQDLTLGGGAPNNVLTLRKAENKFI